MAKTANILIIILELLGFRVSIGDRKWKIFAYYTQISNLITLVSSVVYVITGGAAWLRYTSACMLTMTFVVTLFILVPFGGGFRRLMLSGNGLYHHTLCPVLSVISYGFRRLMLSGNGLYHHTLCPVLSVISYVLWEGHSAVWQVPVAITFVYGIVMMYLNYRECFDGPYPFFRVNHQSRMATVLWMAALTGMITVIALVMRWVA